MISEFLDIEQQLKRRFREDSVTDIIIASLLSLLGRNIVVLTPRETNTGSDFDLVIVAPALDEAVQFRIQAKRLTPHKQNWMLGSYVELAHPHNTGKQSQTLMRSLGREAIYTIPLYAFYNPSHVCAASGGTVSGIDFASGWEIRERIRAMVKAKPKRLPLKRIGALQHLFFPLSTMLCTQASNARTSGIPLPMEARSSVVSAIENRSLAPGFDPTVATLNSTRIRQKFPADLEHAEILAHRRRLELLPTVPSRPGFSEVG